MAHFAFFGTPEFAVPALEALHHFCLKNDHTLAMVVCQPDKPSHRGKKIHAPPVKEFAIAHHLTVLQPDSLKKNTPSGDHFYAIFQAASIDLAIVVAYGRILPKRLLDLPSLGFINIHASLLPRWRGASPIQHAIAAGDKETGISIMALVPELDAGDVYHTTTLPISPDDDAMKLSQKLSSLGRDTLLTCLPKLLSKTLKKTPQPTAGITYAPLLEKKSGEINWHWSAEKIINHCLAMQPWPGSYTFHQGKMLRLFNAAVLDQKTSSPPGTVIEIGKFLSVQASDKVCTFQEAQLDGKKRLPIKDLLNGYPIKPGDSLGHL